MAIRVHLNLRRGDWSLTDRGKVFAHVPKVVFARRRIYVSLKGRGNSCSVKAHCREVHAWAIGERSRHCVAWRTSGDNIQPVPLRCLCIRSRQRRRDHTR